MLHTVRLEDKVTITESEAPRPCLPDRQAQGGASSRLAPRAGGKIAGYGGNYFRPRGWPIDPQRFSG